MEQDTCIAKVGEPFHMKECGEPVEYVTAGDPIYQGAAQAVYTGFYHVFETKGHHAVSRRWTA